MNNISKKIAFSLGIGFAIILGAPFAWGMGENAMLGLRVNGIPVGGKNKSELETFLIERNERLKNDKITLQSGKVREELPFSRYKAIYHADEIDHMLSLGREGNLWQQWVDRWTILFKGKGYMLKTSYDEKALQKDVKELEAKYGKPAKNAKPIFNGNTVTFEEGRPYLKIKTDELLKKLERDVERGVEVTEEIPVAESVLPDMTEEEAKKVNRVLSKYTTYFYEDENRSTNIRIAAEAISGVYLEPGETFSYNESTGKRSKENGYKEAPVIVNGKLEPGTGGGVCQVSSTLFNAVMLAGLKVTEISCHYSPVSYMPIGRDATVAEGYIDFKFKNNLTSGVYIYAVYEPGAVTIYMLGNQVDKPSDVEISTISDEVVPFKTIEKIDPSLKVEKEVDEGHEGRNVLIKQSVKWADGRTYEDTFFSDYEPKDTIITYQKKPEEKDKTVKTEKMKKSRKKENKNG